MGAPKGAETARCRPHRRSRGPISFRRELLHGIAHNGSGRTWTGRDAAVAPALSPRRSTPAGRGWAGTDGVLPLPEVPVFNGLDWFWGSSALGRLALLASYPAECGGPAMVDRDGAAQLSDHRLAGQAGRRAAGGRVPRGARRRRGQVAAGQPVHPGGDAPLTEPCGRRRRALRLRSTRGLRDIYPQLARPADRGDPARTVRASRASLRMPMPPWGRAFTPAAPAATREPVRLLIFGVVRPYKGHAELADAVRLLTTSGLDIHVSVVGEVWQGYREPLERARGDSAAGPTDHRRPICRGRRGSRILRRRPPGRPALSPLLGLRAVAHRDELGAAGRDHVGRRARRGDRRLHGSRPGAAR